MNIDQVAIFSKNIVIYWSSLIIALGIMAGFFLSLALFVAHNKRTSGMWVSFPFAILISLIVCRLLHWYCHEEQYSSVLSALTDFTNGSYCIQGILLGVPLSVAFSKLLGTTDNVGRQLDAMAPGIALTIAIIRLSSFFNSSCRSKYTIINDALKKLPFGISDQYSATGEYRFATFFIEFIVMMLICLILIYLYYKLHNCRMKKPANREGNVYKLFVVLFGGVEMLLDSTRNDSSFFHVSGSLKNANKVLGFVSAGQLIAMLTILFIMIYYMRCSRMANGRKPYHTAIWILYILSQTITGCLEYCVQRWSNYHVYIYIGMTVSVLLVVVSVFLAYNTCVEAYSPRLDEYE